MVELAPYRPPKSGLDFFRPVPKGSPLRWMMLPLTTIWFFLAAGFMISQDNIGGPLSCILFLSIPFGWLGTFFLLGLAHKMLVDARLGTPTVHADTRILQRGGSLSIVLEQPAKNQVALSSASIQLIRHEWVKYTSGTDTVTKTHDEIIDEVQSTEQIIEAGDSLRLEANFRIPDNAMHNLSYEHNRVQWLVVIHVDIRAWPDYYDRYDLEFPAR